MSVSSCVPVVVTVFVAPDADSGSNVSEHVRPISLLDGKYSLHDGSDPAALTDTSGPIVTVSAMSDAARLQFLSAHMGLDTIEHVLSLLENRTGRHHPTPGATYLQIRDSDAAHLSCTSDPGLKIQPAASSAPQ
jgi:hypothetical protein